ncbi:MAG: type I-D CRISPR-associated protein Cas10d/Csc3 [Nitrospiraceae bacterium]|nr:type I-D CRISPR-associated protein Cas10d/Csc3 [Nitrospiraceae bacterium]
MNIRKPEPTISAERIREYIEKTPVSKSNSHNILAEYYERVDPRLLDSGIAYLPAKSVEMGKVDQPMIGHIRNGVWAIVELNEALSKLGVPYLGDSALKEVIGLFVNHELHKINEEEWKDQFDISEYEAVRWAEKFGLLDFAPELNAHDYQSVAVALHKKTGFHSNLSPKFTLYNPWVYLADTLASIEVPCASGSMQKQLDQIDDGVDFYYHTFNESTGIISNLVHTGVAAWAEKKGLVPLLIFERGVVYVGKSGIECKLDSKEDIEEIYDEFKEKLNNAHPAITDPTELHKSKSVQGSKGLYKFDNVNFFYGGLRSIVKAFLAAAVLDNDGKKRKVIIDIENSKIIADGGEPDMKYPPADIIDIPANYITSIKADGKEIDVDDVLIHCSNVERKEGKYTLVPQSVEINGMQVNYSKVEIDGTGLMTSQVGYRLHIKEDFDIDIGWGAEIIPYSRAISGVRMQFIDPLIKMGALETDNAVLETCKMFGTESELAQKISDYAVNTKPDHHVVGGFWNYSYVIARDLLDRDVDGMSFKNISPEINKVKYLEKLAFEYFDKIPTEKRNELESAYLYPYKDKMLVWISENLDFNGSMVYGVFENMSNKFDSYLKGTGICKLTNDTLYDQKSPNTPSQPLSMLGYTYSNRLPIGPPQTKPKLEVSVPVAIELGLRRMGHAIKGGEHKIYYKLIPDHFYTPILSEIFSDLLGMFDGTAQTNIRGIAQSVLSSDHPVYHSLTGDLASEYGQKIFRYAGTGFRGLFSTYDIVFNKSRKTDTEYWFMGAYLGMILAATTGCRVVVGENPICVTRGDEFKEIVKFDSPYASVKRVFGDRIRLSELPESIRMTSLIINMGYEYKLDDGLMPKHLQKLRTHLFPGSAILKEIRRQYEKDKTKGGMGTFINKARGYSKKDDERVYDDHIGLVEQAMELDKLGGNTMTVKTIHELAALGLRVAIPKGYEPHRIEKLFRESVKAIKAKEPGSEREDYVDAVSGRLLKMMRRAGNDQFYYVSGLYDKERTLNFAESFVDLVFYKIADGQPGKLKKKSNDMSDGFYAATLYQWDGVFKTTKAEVEAAKAAKKEKEARS